MFFKLLIMLFVAIVSLQAKGMYQSVSPDEATLLQDGKVKKFCVQCGMNLTKFYKNDHALIYKDGTKKQFCSLHCLVEELKNSDSSKIDKIKVVDADSLKFIDTKDAWYVIGSKIKGTMTKNSKYAFSSKEKAQEFAKANGGEIKNYQEALEIAQKDYKKDITRICKATL